MSEPWIERWREGRTGWHEATGNASLRKHWRFTGRNVLVPLCGKSVDLRWLADQGNRVVGVELSALAVESFFAEQQLDYSVEVGELVRYDALGADITIYCGDFFALGEIRCDAHFDRGALIALPPDARPGYARHVNSLLTPGAEQLVITLNYEHEKAAGPPYSITDEEVLGYWSGLQCVDAYDDIGNAPPKFVEAGIGSLVEKVWRSIPPQG